MCYLIDTNVVSELRKKTKCDPHVRKWQDGVVETDVYISVISMMEIKYGIPRVMGKDTAFGKVLEEWYVNQVRPAFKGRVLPVDLSVAECCSEIMALRTRGMADGLIAATAKIHGLVLVTRNLADFEDVEIDLVNPWEA